MVPGTGTKHRSQNVQLQSIPRKLSDILQNSFQRTQGAYIVFFNTHSKRALCNLCKMYMRWSHGKKISKKFKKKRLFTLEIIIVTVWCSGDGFNHVRTAYWQTHVDYIQHIIFLKRLCGQIVIHRRFFFFRQWKIWYFWSSDVSQFYRKSHLCRQLTIHQIFLYLCECDRRSGRMDHATFLMQWKNICRKSWERNVLARTMMKNESKGYQNEYLDYKCSSNCMELYVKHK